MSYRILQSFFRDNPKVAIACSGGTDSAFLVHVAAEMGADILPVVVRSHLNPERETEEAVEFVRSQGLEPLVLDVDLLSLPEITSNGTDRCYHCKRAMFSAVRDAAAAHGYDVVADGTNASDMEQDRPGTRALRELGIASPLRDAGLTKSQIRRLSRSERLPTWNKHSNSCLATRVDTGVPITAEVLERVMNGEDAIQSLGYEGFRVRTDGRVARVVMPASMWQNAVAGEDDIRRALSPFFEGSYVSEETRDERGRAEDAPGGCRVR